MVLYILLWVNIPIHDVKWPNFFLHKKHLEEMRNVNNPVKNCLTKDRIGNTKLDVKIALLLEGTMEPHPAVVRDS